MGFTVYAGYWPRAPRIGVTTLIVSQKESLERADMEVLHRQKLCSGAISLAAPAVVPKWKRKTQFIASQAATK